MIDTKQLTENIQIPWSQGSWAVKSFMERQYGRRGAIAVLNRLSGVITDPEKRAVRDATIELFKQDKPSQSSFSTSSYSKPLFSVPTSSTYSNFMKVESPSPKPHLDRAFSSGSSYLSNEDRAETAEVMGDTKGDWGKFSSSHPILSKLVGGALVGGAAMAGTYALASGEPVRTDIFK
jgi:hypothetical protein